MVYSVSVIVFFPKKRAAHNMWNILFCWILCCQIENGDKRKNTPEERERERKKKYHRVQLSAFVICCCFLKRALLRFFLNFICYTIAEAPKWQLQKRTKNGEENKSRGGFLKDQYKIILNGKDWLGITGRNKWRGDQPIIADGLQRAMHNSVHVL